MLFGALLLVGYQAWFVEPAIVWQYVLIVLSIGLVRSVYDLFRTRSSQFLLFMIYGFLHVLVLVPLRLVALATIRNTGWGTRSLPAADFETQEA